MGLYGDNIFTIDNSDNGGSNNCPAIILLPDGLFTEHIFKLLHNNYPDIFTGNPGEGVNNNASYLISTYFEKVSKDIDELVQISKQYDNMATVKKMKEIVPEYKSKNSEYEVLDKK